jgi:hypothetical protein
MKKTEIWSPLTEAKAINREVKYLTKYMHGLQLYVAWCKKGCDDVTLEELSLIKDEIDRTAAYVYRLKARLLEIDFNKIVGK